MISSDSLCTKESTFTIGTTSTMVYTYFSDYANADATTAHIPIQQKQSDYSLSLPQPSLQGPNSIEE